MNRITEEKRPAVDGYWCSVSHGQCLWTGVQFPHSCVGMIRYLELLGILLQVL